MLSSSPLTDFFQAPIPPILPQSAAPSVPEDILLRFKRRDIAEIIRHASSYPEYFAPELLEPIVFSSSDKLQTTVLQLSQKVSELMGQVAPFDFPQESPEIVLRTPGRFFRLMESLRFTDLELPSYVGGSTLEAILIRERIFEYAKRSHNINQTVLEVAQRLRLPKTESLQALNRQIFLGLEQFSQPPEAPEEAYSLLKQITELCTASVEERFRLYTVLRKTIRGEVEYLKLFVGCPSFDPNLAILDLFPSPLWERGWLQQVMNLHADLEPYLAIVQMIEEFLQPYLDGTVIAQTEDPRILVQNGDLPAPQRIEDSFRVQIMDWLLAEFRGTFPHAQIPESRIQAIALSAYLHFGSRGIHLGGLKGSYEIRSRREDLYRAPYLSLDGSEYYEQRYVRTAMETEFSAVRIQDSFTRALQHSLPIDFPSLHLNDREIKALAHVFLCNPEVPLPEGWDEEDDLKRKVLFPESRASPGHKFPWD
jgi:hypothetical protein